MKKRQNQAGSSHPLGATVYPDGINFCLFSKNCTSVELLLFDKKDHSRPIRTITLDPETNKTFYYWHIFIPGLKNGQLYGYRVHGPHQPEEGMRFDGEKVLVDPYARAVVMDTYDRNAAIQPGDNCAKAIKSVAIDPSGYDWEGDKSLDRPFSKTIIYELHVGGFTKDPSSGLKNNMRGTYRGLIEKIPYLKKLGITAVELLPVQQFDPYDVPDPSLTNYWGYNQIAFFALHTQYCSCDDPIDQLNEFRDMVKALHKAGIEVILDVVFNHTAEGNENGPTLSFKGLENIAYYLLMPDQRYYHNFSGTGNTINANHSIIRRMIIDCLRYWVDEMHVDGFRFDLASVLSRDEYGKPIVNPPILWEIESDPVLAPIKIIAEAWDTGQYQLGSFIGDKWAEWNGMFRDDIRSFVKGDEGQVWNLSRRILGSPDIFKEIIRDPNRSINFITCHDGFTLNDLVSYNQKHNLANGEDNQDGHDDTHSWNCGVEGPSDNIDIQHLREKQIKNFLTLLMISKGTPMLLMGDERRRTQQGNNNAYCQDNPISWFDWNLTEKQEPILRFAQHLTRFNLDNQFFQEKFYWQEEPAPEGSFILFHGTQLHQPDYSQHSHSLAFSLYNKKYEHALHIMINAYWEELTFEIPELDVLEWRKIIDTELAKGEDIVAFENGLPVKNNNIIIAPRSIVLLMGKNKS